MLEVILLNIFIGSNCKGLLNSVLKSEKWMLIYVISLVYWICIMYYSVMIININVCFVELLWG